MILQSSRLYVIDDPKRCSPRQGRALMTLFGQSPAAPNRRSRHYDGRVTLRLGTLGTCMAAHRVAMACGVSVGQPIGLGLGPTVDAASDVVTSRCADAADAADANRDPLTDGLVAYWKLDEKRATDVVIDSSQRGAQRHRGQCSQPVGFSPADFLPQSVEPYVRWRQPICRHRQHRRDEFEGESRWLRGSTSRQRPTAARTSWPTVSVRA